LVHKKEANNPRGKKERDLVGSMGKLKEEGVKAVTEGGRKDKRLERQPEKRRKNKKCGGQRGKNLLDSNRITQQGGRRAVKAFREEEHTPS